jgi:hypothetical protein
MRRARLLVVLLAAAMAVASVAVSGVQAATETDWPQFHFDAAHTGHNPNETTLTASNVSGLNRLWTTALGPGGESWAGGGGGRGVPPPKTPRPPPPPGARPPPPPRLGRH